MLPNHEPLLVNLRLNTQLWNFLSFLSHPFFKEAACKCVAGAAVTTKVVWGRGIPPAPPGWQIQEEGLLRRATMASDQSHCRFFFCWLRAGIQRTDMLRISEMSVPASCRVKLAKQNEQHGHHLFICLFAVSRPHFSKTSLLWIVLFLTLSGHNWGITKSSFKFSH